MEDDKIHGELCNVMSHELCKKINIKLILF